MCLHIDESREDILTSVVTENMKEVDDSTADSLDVVVCWGTNHRLKIVNSGKKGSSDFIQGQHDARTRRSADVGLEQRK